MTKNYTARKCQITVKKNRNGSYLLNLPEGDFSILDIETSNYPKEYILNDFFEIDIVQYGNVNKFIPIVENPSSKLKEMFDSNKTFILHKVYSVIGKKELKMLFIEKDFKKD